MATGVDNRRTSAESRIEWQLADTCRRMRLFDVGASLLLLGSLVWAYALLFAMFDLAVEGADAGWPLAMRWLGYALFLALAAALAAQAIGRLLRRINPYYAARRLEHTVPDAKNSVISWLDLKQEALPPALRKTLGTKAANDLEEADPEQAIDRGPTWYRLGMFAILTLGMLVLIAARPGQFFSLMQRAFLPFYHGQLVGQTRITLLRPEDGDAVVTEKQSLTIVAQITGRIPDVNQPGAPALYYRYQQGDRFVPQPLQQDPNGHWTIRLSPDQIGSSGLWYKIAAGDAETPVYQVSVRAQPFVQGYEITYKYRPYLGRPVEKIAFPNQQSALPFIKRHQGTEVALVVRTNRPLRHGGVHLVMGKATKDVAGGVLKDDPQAFRTQWTLEKSGEFAIDFTSEGGERFRSRVPFPMDVLVDTVPTVALTRPAQNVGLPANGTLEVEGTADDDFGIKRVTLQLEVVEDGKGIALKPQPYRGGESLEMDGKGMYPWHLDYLDLIKLDELRTTADLPLMLKPGVVVRYWLEAADNSDFLHKDGNVGKSLAYEIKILPPQDEQKQREARKGAQDKQKKHNAQQDKNLTQQKKDREHEANGGDKQGNNSPDKEKADKLKDEIKNDVDRHEQPSPSDKGGAKGEEKDHAQNKPGEGGGAGAPTPEQKDQQPGDANQAGDSKGASQQGGAGQPQQPGEAKDAGAPKDGKGGNESGGNESGGGAQSDPKAGAPKDGPGDASGQGKDGGDDGAKGPPENASQSKSAGPKNKTPQESQTKGGEDSGMNVPSAQTKPGGGKAKDGPDPNQPPQGIAKPEEATGPRSLSKEKGPEGLNKKSLDPQLKNQAKNAPGEEVGSGKAEGKPPSGQAPKDAPGFTKGEEPAKDRAQQPPTPQQVEQLKELMQRKDGIGEWAKNALEQLSKDGDPKVRDLAKKALDEAGPKKGPGEESGGTIDPKAATNSKLPSDPNGKGGQTSKATPGKAPDNTSPAKTGNNTKEPGSTKPGGTTGQNPTAGGGPSDDLKPDPVRKDLARFGGNLQLEEFLKRATPEYRATHGITPEEWERLLKNAAEYDALLRKLQHARSKTPRDGRSMGNTVGSTGPTQVQIQPGTVDPADSGRAEPPPELRDALERLRAGRK